MAYGLAEGLKKTGVLGRKKKNSAVTFGNHFTFNDALETFRKEGLKFETEKGHVVKIFLDKNTLGGKAEMIRKIIREGFGYVEPL